MGRAIGETMAVKMIVGNQTRLPESIFDGVRTLTSNIVLEMGYATDLHKRSINCHRCNFVWIYTYIEYDNQHIKEKAGGGIMEKKLREHHVGSLVLRGLMYLAAGITVVALLYVLFYILVNGVPALFTSKGIFQQNIILRMYHFYLLL